MTRIPSFHNMPFVHSFVIKSGSSSYIYISIYFFYFLLCYIRTKMYILLAYLFLSLCITHSFLILIGTTALL